MSAAPKPVTTSMLAAATAVIVSLASLFVAWRQSRLTERQLAASVWPALEFTNVNQSAAGAAITLGLRNGGIGPARIRAFELSYEGKPLKTWWELLEACCGKGADAGTVMSSQILGRILPAGQTFEFLSLGRTAKTDAQWQKLDQARLKFVGHVCYCSALEDCWSLDMTQVEPARVADCAAAAQRPQYNSW